MRKAIHLPPATSRPAPPREPTENEAIPFATSIPLAAPASRVDFLYNGTLVHRLDVPARGPRFTAKPLLERAGTDAYRLSWRAGHPAGLPLLANVRTSADRGRTWIRLASRVAGTEWLIQRSALAGGPDCLLQLVVYDGVNTIAESLPVPGAPRTRMEVRLLGPAVGKALDPPITLTALAQVRGRLDLSGDRVAFTWTCDGQQIATGRCVTWWDPPPGRHLLGVTATSGDYRGQAEMAVEVRGEEISPDPHVSVTGP